LVKYYLLINLSSEFSINSAINLYYDLGQFFQARNQLQDNILISNFLVN